MSDEKESAQPELHEVSDRLAAGLETCRSVVANYKSLLQAEQPLENPQAPAPLQDSQS